MDWLRLNVPKGRVAVPAIPANCPWWERLEALRLIVNGSSVCGVFERTDSSSLRVSRCSALTMRIRSERLPG
jgi:hypothetical protein